MKDEQSAKFRLLPSVHEMIAEVKSIPEINDNYESEAIAWAVRKAIDKARQFVIGSCSGQERKQMLEPVIHSKELLVQYLTNPTEEGSEHFRKWLVEESLQELQGTSDTLIRIINATGVVLHTNCGRAILAPEIAEFVARQAVTYNNLELDILTGERGSRYTHVQDLLKELTGAEAALVVNNNAAAVMLIMNTFANQKEVIVSRGELVEVGGSFRIPEVLKAGGAKLVEIGATNKTWLKDYRDAVTTETAMFLKVHTSNYRIQGFHQAVSVLELVKLGEELGIPVIEDLGSGSFIDGVDLGLPKEPTIQESVKTGASLVTFSGDKLLGGPQAGIIVGKKEMIDKLKNNQLTRAVRIDKLTLSALVATLRMYQRGETKKIPVWAMLTKDKVQLQKEAEYLQSLIYGIENIQVEIQENSSFVGGGAFPTAVLPSFVCAIQPLKGSAVELEEFLRAGSVPVLARIEKDRILLDPRTLLPDDYLIIAERLKAW